MPDRLSGTAEVDTGRSTDPAYPGPADIGLVPEDRTPREMWMREWRSPRGVAVGMNRDGTVDELCGPYEFHVEQMAESYYWARFGDLHVHFRARPRKRCELILGWLDTDD
jgi:hypothetical protein